MRVLALLVPSPAPGGLAHQVALLIRFPPEGFLPVLYLPESGGNALSESAEALGVPVRRALPRGARDLGGLLRLRRRLLADRVDVVHIHASSTVEAPALAPLARSIGARRVVVTMHAPTWSPSATGPRRWANRLSLKFAGTVVSPSMEGVSHLVRTMGVPRSRAAHVASAVDTARYDPGAKGNLRALMHAGPGAAPADPGAFLIGSAGSIGAAKDPALFAAVLGAISEASVRGVWIGDGPERHVIESGGSPIHVTGWTPRPETLYPDIDVFIMTSRAEGTPVVLLEAMACAKAVVATRVGGIPEVVEDGVTGLLAEPGDREGIVSLVRTLLRDPVRRASIGGAARERILAAYGAQRQSRELGRVYGGA